MKHLIILNQQPFIPAFMLTMISSAKVLFDDISYINTSDLSNKKDVDQKSRIQFYCPNKMESFLALVKSFIGVFSPLVFRDVKKCLREKGPSLKTIKQFIVEQYVHHRLLPIAKKKIKAGKAEEMTVLSTWFAASAFTASKLKESYPSIKAVSLAHSYEILSIRNPFVKYMHNEYKHKCLDGVFFISYKIRDMYLEWFGVLLDELLKKTFVSYLGSKKESNRLSPQSLGVFCICTCSRLIPLKRIDLLFDAIEDWDLCPIKWTHMGDGPLYSVLSERAAEVSKKNPLVEIEFTGRVSNERVKLFYASNSVDLFINLSEIEGLPISIMEAISYGIPVLATNVGGTCEIVVSETGYLAPKDISKDLVRKYLVEYYQLSDGDKKALRLSAYHYWEKHFNASENMTKLFEEIDRIPSC